MLLNAYMRYTSHFPEDNTEVGEGDGGVLEEFSSHHDTPSLHTPGWEPRPQWPQEHPLNVGASHCLRQASLLDPTSLLSSAEQKQVYIVCGEVWPGSSSSLPYGPSPVPGGVKVKGHWGFWRLHRIQVDLRSVDGRRPRRGEYVLKGRAGSSG